LFLDLGAYILQRRRRRRWRLRRPQNWYEAGGGRSEAKLARLGQEAQVIRVWADKTITCTFDDGETMGFPCESIARQLSVRQLLEDSGNDSGSDSGSGELELGDSGIGAWRFPASETSAPAAAKRRRISAPEAAHAGLLKPEFEAELWRLRGVWLGEHEGESDRQARVRARVAPPQI
jgi:hypothetical protein